MKPIDVLIPPRCHHCFYRLVKRQGEVWHCEYEETREFDEPCDKYDESICLGIKYENRLC